LLGLHFFLPEITLGIGVGKGFFYRSICAQSEGCCELFCCCTPVAVLPQEIAITHERQAVAFPGRQARAVA